MQDLLGTTHEVENHLQLLIGISMVVRGFPLWLATAHNAGAAVLLLAVVALMRSLRPAWKPS